MLEIVAVSVYSYLCSDNVTIDKSHENTPNYKRFEVSVSDANGNNVHVTSSTDADSQKTQLVHAYNRMNSQEQRNLKFETITYSVPKYCECQQRGTT